MNDYIALRIFEQVRSNLKQNLTLIFFLSFTFMFSQQYNFKYVLDYNKVNGKIDELGEFRIDVENDSIVLQVFSANKNSFAVVLDIKNRSKHYFDYKSFNRNKNSFDYIGTVLEEAGLDIFTIRNIGTIRKNDIIVDYIITLNKEFGKRNLYYISTKSQFSEFNAKKTIKFYANELDNLYKSSVKINMTYENYTQITVPLKIMEIPFSVIQNLTKNTVE